LLSELQVNATSSQNNLLTIALGRFNHIGTVLQVVQPEITLSTAILTSCACNRIGFGVGNRESGIKPQNVEQAQHFTLKLHWS